MTKKHFERFAIAAANIIGNMQLDGYMMTPVIVCIAQACAEFNPRFDPDLFDRRVREIVAHRSGFKRAAE